MHTNRLIDQRCIYLLIFIFCHTPIHSCTIIIHICIYKPYIEFTQIMCPDRFVCMQCALLFIHTYYQCLCVWLNIGVTRINICMYVYITNRSSISSSATSHDCSRYFTIFKCTKNIELNTFGSTSINFYIRVVNSSGNYTSGM